MTDDPTPPALPPAVPARMDPAATDVRSVAERELPGEGIAAPTYGRGTRAMFAFVAVMCLVVAAILGLGGSWLLAASMVVFGGGAGYFAATGRRPADPALAPASRHFHELADPTRPLTPEDVSIPPGGGDRSLPRPRQEG